MSSNFVPLEEAAKRLGKTSEELVEMRSRGDIFGYRDGASWKFKPEEIERVASELMGDALDEDPAGSSILVSESDLGSAGSKVGSTIGSDIKLADDDDDLGSDVSLVPDPESGSDVKLVAGRSGIRPASGLNLEDDESSLAESSHVIGGGSDIKPGSSNRLIGSDLKLAADDDDDDELSLQADDDDLMISGSGLGSGLGSGVASGSGAGSGLGSDIEIGSDIGLSLEGSDVLAGLSPVVKPVKGGSSGKDLSLSDDDDLVLGAGSDLALGNDSGINLMSPSDSGISLEDEPLDLAGSGISGLDLAAEGSDASGSAIGSGVGSGIEIAQAEEFQLSPSGAIDSEDDSGSQVIELEDSSEFGEAAVALPAADGGFGDDGFGATGGFDDTMGATAGAGTATAVMAAPDVPFQTGMVLVLLGVLMVMGLSGILVTDLVRNMWQYAEGSSDLSGGFTKAVAGMIPSK